MADSGIRSCSRSTRDRGVGTEIVLVSPSPQDRAAFLGVAAIYRQARCADPGTSGCIMTTAETIEIFAKYVIGNYRRYPVCLVRGEGSYVWDAEGNRYLDFFPGWGCNLLGHCPPRVVEAVREQVGKLIHVPNTWYMEPQGLAGQGPRRTQRPRRPVLLLQQRHRGERSGHQAGPAQRQAERALQDHHDAQQLPWPNLSERSARRPSRSITRASSRCWPASTTPRSAISTRRPS